VEKLRARGGKIVFVRFPVSGELKALEDRLNPRTRDWERLLKETNVPGIYFEDFPELASFTCPEWSHLSAGDSVEFSKLLVPHLRTALQLSGPIRASRRSPFSSLDVGCWTFVAEGHKPFWPSSACKERALAADHFASRPSRF
jgi:hypothetical protein